MHNLKYQIVNGIKQNNGLRFFNNYILFTVQRGIMILDFIKILACTCTLYKTCKCTYVHQRFVQMISSNLFLISCAELLEIENDNYGHN